MRKIICYRFLLVFSFVLTVFLSTAHAQDTPRVLSIGDPAPPLSLAKFLKGKPVSAFEKGQVYVVELWATWCKPCIAGMPHLSELARKYRNDVTIIGVSIKERSPTTVEDIENFVAGMGDKMDYSVAIEKDGLIASNWLAAYGERGIPYAFVVDQKGRIAWGGYPKELDEVLPKIISGKWDISQAAEDRKQWLALSRFDGSEVVSLLNHYMGNPGKPEGALRVIDSLLNIYPDLKFYPSVGHYTFWSLIKTNPQKAIAFGKQWIEKSVWPKYKTITDAVTGIPDLPSEAYLYGVEAYQGQLDTYPWSMNFPDTYKKMADFYVKAGDDKKAAEFMKKAENYKPDGTDQH